MAVVEKPAEAPFGRKTAPDAKIDAKASEPRVGSTSLMMPDVGHYVVVQVEGHKSSPRIVSLVGVYHSLVAAERHAGKDRGLLIFPVEVLG